MECAKIFIQEGADVNIKDDYNVTPLHYAASVVRKFFAKKNTKKFIKKLC